LSVPKKTYFVLSRDFKSSRPAQQFGLTTIKAKDSETGWGVVETEYDTTNEQHWLMTPKELAALKIELRKGGRK
jgi:hypothetical protein